MIVAAVKVAATSQAAVEVVALACLVRLGTLASVLVATIVRIVLDGLPEVHLDSLAEPAVGTVVRTAACLAT